MKKLLNTISAFQTFQVIRYSTFILIGVVFAKSKLSQHEIGEYETFVFLAGAISFFWLNGLLKALLPLSYQNCDSARTNVFSAFIVIQVLSILSAAFLCFFQPAISSTLLNDGGIPEIELLLLFIVFGVPANLVEYYYLIKRRNISMLIYASISFFIQFVLVVVPAVWDFGIKLVLQGLLVSSLLRYAWLLLVLIVNCEVHVSKRFMAEHLKLGLPLVVATFLSGSAQYIDGFIVRSRFENETFAIFRYGARELPLALLFANALSNAMLSKFAQNENLRDNLKKLKNSVSRLMHFLFPLTALLILISKPVFPLVFSPDFAESALVFNIYLLLLISRMLMPQTVLNGLKLTNPIMTAAFVEFVINVSLSLCLIQYFGIAGIAMATFIAYLMEKIYLAFVLYKKLKISMSDYISLRIYLLYSFGIVVIFILAEQIW